MPPSDATVQYAGTVRPGGGAAAAWVPLTNDGTNVSAMTKAAVTERAKRAMLVLVFGREVGRVLMAP